MRGQRWFTTSHLDHWRAAGPASQVEWVANLRVDDLVQRPRHLFELADADDPGCPSVGFRYRADVQGEAE